MKTRFKYIAMLLAITAVGGLASIAFASGVHIQKPGATFTADHNNLTLNASGVIAGLGSGAIVTLTATADPTTSCSNPGNANKPPGQNPASITISGTTGIPDGNTRNGSRPFSVTTNPPSQPTSGTAGGCPNDSWTAHIDDLCFTSATLTFQQPDKHGNLVTVFAQTYNFNPCL